MIFGKYDFDKILKEIRKVYQIPSGKKLNLEFYEFDKDRGRWHIQVRAGKDDGLASGYDPGQGEWWPIEMWLKNPVPPVLLPITTTQIKGEINMFKAILSTTVIPIDGVYKIETLEKGNIPNVQGVPHYIGHPATKEIVEKLGAVPAPTKLFEGLQVGEAALCFPIAQGKSNRVQDGFSAPHQDVTLNDLQVRVITRLK